MQLGRSQKFGARPSFSLNPTGMGQPACYILFPRFNFLLQAACLKLSEGSQPVHLTVCGGSRLLAISVMGWFAMPVPW